VKSSKRTISPLLYFILISSFTNLAFLVFGIVLLALFAVKLSDIGLQIIIFLLFWKGGLVGFVSWYWHKRADNKDFLVKFIGIYLGRFFGIIIGGFIGYRIFDTLKQSNFIGLIVGALALYFAGRWVGSKVSIQIGKQLDKVFSIPEIEVAGKVADTKLARKFASTGFILYGVILPLLLVIIGLLMNYYDVPIGYFPELLPISRIVVIIFSIFSICSPWLLKNRWLNKYQTTTSSPESVIYWLGLVFSVIPVVYGFILFLAMGASIIELSVYAVVSSVATIIWSMNQKGSIWQKAG